VEAAINAVQTRETEKDLVERKSPKVRTSHRRVGL
jgi:hypothetical protein